MADSDDDGEPRLSTDTLAALSEFFTEQAIAERETQEGPHKGRLMENWVLALTLCM